MKKKYYSKKKYTKKQIANYKKFAQLQKIRSKLYKEKRLAFDNYSETQSLAKKIQDDIGRIPSKPYIKNNFEKLIKGEFEKTSTKTLFQKIEELLPDWWMNTEIEYYNINNAVSELQSISYKNEIISDLELRSSVSKNGVFKIGEYDYDYTFQEYVDKENKLAYAAGRNSNDATKLYLTLNEDPSTKKVYLKLEEESTSLGPIEEELPIESKPEDHLEDVTFGQYEEQSKNLRKLHNEALEYAFKFRESGDDEMYKEYLATARVYRQEELELNMYLGQLLRSGRIKKQ